MKTPAGTSPIDELWAWNASHDTSAPPWLAQRADDRFTTEVAAREPLSLETEYVVGRRETALDELAGRMTCYADRNASNARLGPRLARLGYEADAAKLLHCRTSGGFMQRESDAQFIPIPDSKCRRPRVCPHCARDEAARLHRRYVKRLCALARTHSLYFRSEEHTSELQSHSFISYAVFCLKKKKAPV